MMPGTQGNRAGDNCDIAPGGLWMSQMVSGHVYFKSTLALIAGSRAVRQDGGVRELDSHLRVSHVGVDSRY